MGPPIAMDRIFALRLRAPAANLAPQGRFGRHGRPPERQIVDIPLAEAVASTRKLRDHFLDRYENFFGPNDDPES